MKIEEAFDESLDQSSKSTVEQQCNLSLISSSLLFEQTREPIKEDEIHL